MRRAGSSRVLIGEIYLPLDRLVKYYGAGPQLSGANLPFNFALIQTQVDGGGDCNDDQHV